jgi:hypothetical protein
MTMTTTTKPKTGKAAAAKPATPTPKRDDAPGEPKRKISEINRLIARWRLLEADQTYQATIAETEKESERLIASHFDERRGIEERLTELVPQTFSELCQLLEFATDFVANDGCMDDPADMLRNVRAGLSEKWEWFERTEGMNKESKYGQA